MPENIQKEPQKPKSPHAEREEKILRHWIENGIFEKSLEKSKKSGKAFIFYEGPPTANGHPGIHHLEARAFKDAIPRYKTMRGYYVRRKGGWDTHGLPVEIQVEKELGLKSKKEVEAYGVEKFNEKCKESVWKFVHEWEEFTDRMGYWVELKNPYITYKPEYIESVWNVVKETGKQGLLYKDYKVLPWCPRCGTALSSHELAQGYEDVKDISLYVKFPSEKPGKFFLAWTTTPWTLPGNVALAVGEKIDYVEIETRENGEHLILAKERLSIVKGEYSIVKEFKGRDLVGMKYTPLYPFMSDVAKGAEKDKIKNAYRIYSADFVTTTDGTGIVHIAPMYGQDDFVLGTANNLPKFHLVNEDGTFRKEVGFLAGAFVKEEGTDVAIIRDLAGRPDGGLLFAKEKYEHTYPHCWRCHTPLIYYARDSWYVRMSELREELVRQNEGINWEPEHIKEGRFGEWLREVKDWAISRERYWGTPMPIWSCNACEKTKVIGSIQEISVESANTYFVMRHGEAENNVRGILNYAETNLCHLTDEGRRQVREAARHPDLRNIDLVFVSPLLRTRETAEIVKEVAGISEDKIVIENRLHELNSGVMDGRPLSEFWEIYPDEERFDKWPDKGEGYADIKKRVGDLLYDLESRYKGKKILLVTHEAPASLLFAAACGLDRAETIRMHSKQGLYKNAELRKLDFKILPHNHEYELDLHRPYIDEVRLRCDCGGEMTRAKEVMDVWFDSGAMPFAQDHYPFENRKELDKHGFPADFISEAIDQTRGWFYTLHAIGVLMGKGKAYKNVICLGHILDAEGKKMSKSVGNIVNPFEMMEKYGADALRFWMYSVNQPGDSKNFDERTVDEVVKKVFNLVDNVATFYCTYAGSDPDGEDGKFRPENVLDRWIISRLGELVLTVTKEMDAYRFLEASRSIRDFVADLSQWYIRRSRDRFKSDNEADKKMAIRSTKYVLIALAKVMAPFAPFFADHLYRMVGGKMESVHLEDWPAEDRIDEAILSDMQSVRNIVTLGLEARMKARINVRQPLGLLRIRTEKDAGTSFRARAKERDELVSLIKDEVNVKAVEFAEVLDFPAILDTNLTPELREEGNYRELVRAVQDFRKEKGFTVNDKIVLKIATDDAGRRFVEKFRDALARATLLGDLKIVDDMTSGKKLEIGGLSFGLSV